MKKIISTAILGLILALSANTFAAGQSKPKISMAKARAIALKRVSGKVQSAELEREKGKLVYSFDIRTSRGTIREVWVDAYTGKILSVKTEAAREERNEKLKEKREN